MAIINGNLYQIVYRIITRASGNNPGTDLPGAQYIYIIAASPQAAVTAAKALAPLQVSGSQVLQIDAVTQEGHVSPIGQ